MVNNAMKDFKQPRTAFCANSIEKMARFTPKGEKLKILDFILLAVASSCIVLAVILLAIMLHAICCVG